MSEPNTLHSTASHPAPLEDSIFDKTSPGTWGVSLPAMEQTEQVESHWQTFIPEGFRRKTNAKLPEVAQLDAVRHFVRLSQLNHAIDTGFYPLGSCTMKYNPKVCDYYYSQDGLTTLHPMTPESQSQGALRLVYDLQNLLCDVTGFDAFSIQPAAGAQGELVGMMMVKAYFEERNELEQRTDVIVPDAAHGTNPATAAMCGFNVVEIKSGTDGCVDLDALKAALSDKTAAIMLTNPNTLGLFEKDILTISQWVHEVGGLLYYDGANLNAVMGHAKPAEMGFDVMHINTHKTFATPHGGGGPGCGPVGVGETLKPFLPKPVAAFDGKRYYWDVERPLSIGRVKTFNGNFEMMARSVMYILAYGALGLKQVSTDAVLNANYVRHQLEGTYDIQFNGLCKHEFVMNSKHQHAADERINTLTIAKRMMDYGIHPMTVYFPLVAKEAMMIEPTETESKETLDRFIEVMKAIDEECRNNPELVINAPHTMPIKKVDEVSAARKPNLNFYCGC